MPIPLIILIACIPAGVIVYAVFFNRKAIVKRKLRKAPHKDIRDVLNGDIVRIKGTVDLAGKTLTAPLSGRPCAYYHVHIERHQSSGKNSRWVTLVDEEVAGDVIIKDGRHFAIIKTQSAKTYIFKDKHYRSGFLNDAETHLQNFLQSKGHDSVNLIGLNKTIRYREGILEKDELVTVAGKARWIDGAIDGVNLPAARVLLIEAHEKDLVYFTDDHIA